jgi:hypothetical protein
MEHHALRLRSDGTIDTDYYVSRARARRQESARLIDEKSLILKQKKTKDGRLGEVLGACDADGREATMLGLGYSNKM